MGFLQKATNGFIKIFGDIKVFKWPMFLVYDPGSYQVKGKDMREVLNLVKPGDILLRGYNNYLDGYFIPGYFSHVGLYVGEVTKDDASRITVPGGTKLFHTGKQMVVHAMAEGVFVQDVLDFCRADRMLILRFPEEFQARQILEEADVPYSTFNEQERELFDSLNTGKTITLAKALTVIFNVALRQVGKKYDFSFDFKNYNNLSCTEFLYFCVKSLEAFHRLKPTEKKFVFYRKKVVVPDAFLRANLEIEWKSPSVDSAPYAPTVVESARQYVNAGVIAIQVTEFIRNLGFEARAHIDGNYRVVCPLVAQDAGLGTIGRMGLLMTPHLGPRVRIAVITSDIPLLTDQRSDDPSIYEFCHRCKKCAEVCPSQAISFESPVEIEGVSRWQINQEKCFTYWTVCGTDCGRCVSVCPYSHADNLLHNMVRRGLQQSSFFQVLALKMDDFFYGRRPAPVKPAGYRDL